MANSIKNLLQGYTKGIRFTAILTLLFTIGVGQVWAAEEATLSFNNTAQRTSFSTTKQVWEQNGVTFTNDKSSSTNNVADYAKPVRLYAGSSITISAPGNMTKIVFDCNSSSYATAMKNSIGSSATASSDKVTVTLDGTSNTFSVDKLTAQVRLDAITVTYEESVSCTKPTIATQPTGATYTQGAAATALNVVASGDDLTYQWYSNTSNSTSGATKINDATNFTYTPSTSTVGTKYYYCIVSSGSCSTTSNIVSVVVKNPTYTVIWKSNGVVIRTDNNVESGTNKTAPTISPIPCGDVIAGWTDAENYVHETSTLYSGATPSIQITANKTFYAVFAESGGAGTTSWVKTDIANIAASDEVVITMTNSTEWALNSDNNASAAPKATVITQQDLEGEVAAALLWNIQKDGNNLTIYPNGTTSKWLYCTNDNNGVRVGTKNNKIFTIDASSGYLKNTATSRYVGVYTTNPDWRCYTSTTTNIANQTLAFYKQTTTGGYQNYTTECSVVELTQLDTPTDLQVTSITCTGATLTWDNVANNNGYTLLVKNTSSGTTFNSNIAKDVTSGSPTLNPGTTYTWSVIAKGDGTNYTNSEVADGGSFTTNYQITYDVKDGTWTACADGCVAGGEDFTICSTTPTKNGYNFMGWSTADDQTAEYQAEETIENVSANITLYAVWEQKTYTVILFENGTKTTLTPQTSTSYTLPDELTAGSCQDDTKEFVGWTTTSDLNSATEPTTDYYAKGEIVTLSADETTFFAVFATPGSGGGSGNYIKVTSEPTDWSGDYLIVANGNCFDGSRTTIDAAGNYQAVTISNNEIASSNTTDSYIVSISKSTNIGKYYIKTKSGYYIGSTAASDNELLNSTTTKYDNAISISGNDVTIKGTNSIFRFYVQSGQTPRFRYYKGTTNTVLPQLYKKSSGISYSDYTTTCVEVPDPVLSFVTTPADPIVFDPVNCGSTTTKAQAKTVQVSGANLQEYVSVEVTGPYKIARTSSTNLSDYSTSLTLDKTNTGNINANYSTIYIISCPPAQSTDATTGTLTFTTKKGNTLTVNLSTPTVNCTTYALTFNDRGNKTVENYYAGVEVPQPVDPTGVCTEPIHYVFDGWAEATVTNGSTEYTKVTFPYTMPGQNKTLYAVYRYLTSGGNGDYNLVTSALDDWSGDYLIAYDNETFADGTVGGEDGIGKLRNKVDLSSYISNNTIPATEGDKYHVTLEAVTGGYVLKTQDGKYNYHTNNTGNGISASTITYAQKYPINVNFVSQEEVNLCLTGDAVGSVLRYNTTGYFRFYKNGGQEPVHLYKKASGTTLYTSAPVCGPLVEITSDKDIYVTGGKGVHSTVVAQKKITFAATRLKPSAGGAAPSIKVPAADITLNGSKTDKVKIVDITQNIVLQDDGITYAGTGEITVSYTPTASNIYEDINVQLRAEHNTGSDVILDAFTIHARSLPQEFVIVAKQGDKWYALNGDMSNGSSANPANGQVVLDDDTEPTKATYAPCNTIYTFDGLPNTGDRKYVRFQGTDGAWLWASSGTNVGVQNKTLAQTPAGDNKPYNWEIETTDNITYFFHNANSSRVLRLNDGKFGMYVSGTDVIRILPYEAKCLYNYAPSNLKVSELKGTHVTLTWDAVAGASKYQYSTNATSWTDAGTEPTVTINGLTSETNYTYYIRAYHADAGVSQECIDYSEITFTTADCDDVPTDITYTADLNSITVSWTASAPTTTIKLYSDENGAHTFFTQSGATSPWKISSLTKNTTYYLQILSNGDCASQIIKVRTEDVEVEIVEWYDQGIIVDINTDETVGVTLENEVSYGSGTGADATELFFSKYYEATGNVKLVAIYNGTKNIIDLTDYEIHYGKDSWESQHITLKDFGENKGQIQPGEELILYTTNESNDDNKILDCVNKQYPDGKWVRVTQANNAGGGYLSFAGNKTLVLKKASTIIDVIGALTSTGLPTSAKAKDKPSWGDAAGWNCATGLSIADDTQIGISTNRCLLIRNNTVTSGENAVTSNIDDFVTLCSEWKGAQVPDNDTDNGVAASCENFAYVGTFDYSDYYTQYESMGEEIVFEENKRNSDGTVTIPITDLYKQSCRNIRIKLSNSNGDVLTDREYKVPIMITTTQGTDGEAFLALQENLATIETDANGNEKARHPLSLDEVREICKTCDVVIRDNATLMKMDDNAANDHPQVRDVKIYEGASLVVPNGTNYTINNLSLRRKGDDVASLSVYPSALKLSESAAAPITLDLRVDAQNWHWFTLPYNCNIADVTWVDGSPAQYNVDWFLMYYDGESRSKEQSHYENHWKQYFGTTIEAGKGYIVGITGDINNPKYTFELRFPMSKEVLEDETTDKTVDVRAWGVEDDIRPNQKGWNLVGNPYLAYYQRDNVNSFGGLRLGELIGPDSQTGLWEQTGNLPYVVVPVEGGWVSYEQLLVSETDLLPFTAYFVQVGNDGTHTSEQDLKVSFDHSKLQLSATPMPASIIQRSASEIDEVEEPVIVGVSLTNAKGESDKTSLIIDNQFTDEYEMNADFFKWFGDYYRYYTKPVLYTIGADQGKRAFNALSEELATQPVSLGMYAAQAGNYTFSLDLRSDLSKVQEVWLYDATQNTYTNLLQDSYTFQTAKTESAGRFFLSVKMAPKVSTNIDNIADGTIWATTQDHAIFVNGLLSNAQLWIYDATGKLLHTDQTQYYQHSYSVPISGTYFVRVQNTMQTQTIKVVVK